MVISDPQSGVVRAWVQDEGRFSLAESCIQISVVWDYDATPFNVKYPFVSTGKWVPFGGKHQLAPYAPLAPLPALPPDAAEELCPQCGTDLYRRWWCPECGEAVVDPTEFQAPGARTEDDERLIHE
jgi:hypothetical protein